MTEMEPRITIAKRGDVMLKLGREGESTTEVLVSSSVLSLVSPVFEAMFNGRFTESQALSIESPPTIALSGDDPKAMLLVCKIAHFQTMDLPDELDPNSLADFAVVCNKYQCCKAVHSWVKLWIKLLVETPWSKDSEKSIFVAYLFDLPNEFRQVTLDLLRYRKDDICIASTTHGHDILPLDIFDKMLQEKRKCEQAVCKAFHTATMNIGTCEGAQRTLGKLIVCLTEASIWPLDMSCVNSLHPRLFNMNTISRSSCSLQGCQGCSSDLDIKEQLIDLIGEAFGSVKGLCLDCIKHEAGGAARICRVAHKGGIVELPASS